MSLKQSLIAWLIKWFVIKANLYLLWSKFYQKVFQRDRVALPPILTLKQLELQLSRSHWRADKWYMLMDVISHPEAAYAEFLKTGSFGDCDDHSIFAASILSKLGYRNVQMLSVQWLDKDNKFHGHNVCVFRNTDNLFWHISNQFSGTAVGGFEDVESVSKFIRGKKGILISWFTFPIDLSHIAQSQIYGPLEQC